MPTFASPPCLAWVLFPEAGTAGKSMSRRFAKGGGFSHFFRRTNVGVRFGGHLDKLEDAAENGQNSRAIDHSASSRDSMSAYAASIRALRAAKLRSAPGFTFTWRISHAMGYPSCINSWTSPPHSRIRTNHTYAQWHL